MFLILALPSPPYQRLCERKTRKIPCPFLNLLHSEELGFDAIYSQRILLGPSNRLFLAVIGSPYELRAYEISEGGRRLRSSFSPFRQFGQVEEPILKVIGGDFETIDVNKDGYRDVTWKYCLNFCSDYSGVVVLDVVDEELYDLRYRSRTSGVSLSSNLQDKTELRHWILDWWLDWPGNRSALERGITYSHRGSD